MRQVAERSPISAGVLTLAVICVAAIGASVGAVAQGAESFDKASDGRFTGQALITTDLKWYEAFARPETPVLDVQDNYGPGESGALAILFSNAEPTGGKVRIECDVTALDPAGSRVVVDAGVCYEGPYHGDNILHPALLDLHFTIGPNDPPGQSGFEVTLRDVNSRRSVELRVGFTQGGSE